MASIIDNVNCTACGCICENATIHIRDGAIFKVEGACSLCTESLQGQSAGHDTEPRIEAAVSILAASRPPLIYGLAGSSVETQRAAIGLAESLGATIDLALPKSQRAALQAMQTTGISTCTLGEVKQRADAIVFWGADPTTSHPALFERFIDPSGLFVRDSRYITCIGSQVPLCRHDEFLRLDPVDNLAALAALRGTVGRQIPPIALPQKEQIQQLADRLQSASYSVIFWGSEFGGVAEFESLFRLVRELNSHSRCATMGLGGTQCENVLCWQTGYPCAVNFALGYPRHAAKEFSANELLEQGAVDCVVLVGSKGISQISDKAKSQLAHLPVITLDYPDSQEELSSAVRVFVGRPGVHCSGTVFRMDGVPIQLQAILASPLPSAASILTAIQQGVSASCV